MQSKNLERKYLNLIHAFPVRERLFLEINRRSSECYQKQTSERAREKLFNEEIRIDDRAKILIKLNHFV